MHFTILGMLLLAFWLYCVFDVVMAEPSLVRNLPKLVWLVFVVVVPTVGGIAWLLAGRPAGASFRPGSTDHRPRRPPSSPPRPGTTPPRGPDDDPDFLRGLDDRLRRDEGDEDA